MGEANIRLEDVNAGPRRLLRAPTRALIL